jgi:hypothetical protein
MQIMIVCYLLSLSRGFPCLEGKPDLGAGGRIYLSDRGAAGIQEGDAVAVPHKGHRADARDLRYFSVGTVWLLTLIDSSRQTMISHDHSC